MTSRELDRVRDEDDVLWLLRDGEMELEGRLIDASNTTLRAVLSRDGVTARCVYKPVRGERPLWDFPDGTLAGREVSAYLVSRATGWGLVPPTILRDGPLGPGACQLWIDEPPLPAATPDPAIPDTSDPSTQALSGSASSGSSGSDLSASPGSADTTGSGEFDGLGLVGFVPAWQLPKDWFRIAAAQDEDGERYALAHADDPRLARLTVLDAVLNNADRKGGHVLLGEGERVYGVDHGICFHAEDKLRTVLWGWSGKRLPAEAVRVLGRLADDLADGLGVALAEHLTVAEVAACRRRVRRLLSTGRFPRPSDRWPAVPWPPI